MRYPLTRLPATLSPEGRGLIPPQLSAPAIFVGKPQKDSLSPPGRGLG